MIKTLEFLNSRRPELEIKASFIAQLQDLENRLNQSGCGPLSFTFQQRSYCEENISKGAAKVSPELEQEEIVLSNTFQNSQTGPFP